jgi:hypothetical protein
VDRPSPEWLYALWCTLFETVLFSRTCAKKKTAHKRRPESREETPKEANAASLLHCNNDLGTSLVQRKRRIKCLPLFFAKLRDVGASLSTAPNHRPTHSSPLTAPTPLNWAHLRCHRLIPFCSRKNAENPMKLEDARIILEGYQYDS